MKKSCVKAARRAILLALVLSIALTGCALRDVDESTDPAVPAASVTEMPTAAETPADPAKPAVDPADLTAPTAPTDPTAPAAPAKPAEQSAQPEQTEPTEQIEPTEPIEPTEQTEQSDPAPSAGTEAGAEEAEEILEETVPAVPFETEPVAWYSPVPTGDPSDSSTDEASEEQAAQIDEKIAEALESMTVEEKLGQMFVAAYDASTSPEIASQYGIGGFILFAKDFETETTDSLRQKLDGVAASSRFGVIFAVDEEGGTVTRVSRFPQYRSEKFSAPRWIYASSGLDGLTADTREKAELLRDLGLNMNMAPVADLSTDPADFMYDRSLGLEPEEAGTAVCAMIDAAREKGVASVVKHFPGYGAVADTHTGMAYDSRTLAELENRDLVPFAAAMKNDVGAVMVSHIVTEALDPARPASVSPKVMTYLRETMGWDGVILTDDTAMAGLLDFCTDETSGCAALEAILAGADLVCCSNWADQYPAVAEAVRDGRITEERLNASAERILRLKLEMGLWE